MDLLPRVKDTYDQLSEEETGTVVVDVTTVVELTDDLRDQIKGKMSADLGGKKIVLSEHIDKSILGGVILGCHGKRLDGSARTQLEAARTIMTTAPGGE
jgi:F-type H+-transporting ATPase subunit delta